MTLTDIVTHAPVTTGESMYSSGKVTKETATQLVRVWSSYKLTVIQPVRAWSKAS